MEKPSPLKRELGSGARGLIANFLEEKREAMSQLPEDKRKASYNRLLSTAQGPIFDQMEENNRRYYNHAVAKDKEADKLKKTIFVLSSFTGTAVGLLGASLADGKLNKKELIELAKLENKPNQTPEDKLEIIKLKRTLKKRRAFLYLGSAMAGTAAGYGAGLLGFKHGYKKKKTPTTI